MIKYYLYSFGLAFLFCSNLFGASWRIFLYMDATGNLTNMAFKSITDIMRAKPNNNVEVIIQLHAYNNIALRYQINHGLLTFLEEIKLCGNGKQDFINAVSWAFKSHTAEHTMLVLSNHGWGALDPQWNEAEKKWEAAEISLSNESNVTCQIPLVEHSLAKDAHKDHKAFMFNEVTKTYLSNQDLVDALTIIQETSMLKNKFDIIGFDTCMGSMLEIATCVAPYTKYLLGVQSCALIDGFDYKNFISILNQEKDPRNTVSNFVKVFDKYYCEHDEEGIYTCAALDLKFAESVNNALNALVKVLNKPNLTKFIVEARNKSPRFCLWPIYTDLVAFCKVLEATLLEDPKNMNTEITKCLSNLYKQTNKMVVARCGGKTTQGKAYGFSIYLPFKYIDHSYYTSPFATYSLWPNFLKTICL